jgi:hypothetical protein
MIVLQVQLCCQLPAFPCSCADRCCMHHLPNTNMPINALNTWVAIVFTLVGFPCRHHGRPGHGARVQGSWGGLSARAVILR